MGKRGGFRLKNRKISDAEARRILNKAEYRNLTPKQLKEKWIAHARQRLRDLMDSERVDVSIKACLGYLRMYDDSYEQFIEELREKNPDIFKNARLRSRE